MTNENEYKSIKEYIENRASAMQSYINWREWYKEQQDKIEKELATKRKAKEDACEEHYYILNTANRSHGSRCQWCGKEI